MTTANVFGRHSLTVLFMCFTLSLAAQEEVTFGKSETFGKDKRMCDVLVKVKDGKDLYGNDNFTKIPGTIVGHDERGWEVEFPYETNRLSGEKTARLSGEELSKGWYDSSAIETNLRFLNDADIATLDKKDKESCELLFKLEKIFASTGEFSDEGNELWRKLLPILFERFTTINAEERSAGIKLSIIHLTTMETDWHTDYNDLGFTMLIDDSFEGSPLIYWPGKKSIDMKGSRSVSEYPGDLPSERTYATMEKWSHDRGMKIAPEGTRITLFEGSMTTHGRPLIPEGQKSARGLGFYRKPKQQVQRKKLKFNGSFLESLHVGRSRKEILSGMRPKQ